jgi:hypothetical protein
MNMTILNIVTLVESKLDVEEALATYFIVNAKNASD